ncbi:hypothetical protein BZA77DRAFT_386590 [Pyronema omphalodes]|nr:hypothetical protein BZA77DRAFT_386590 [Pyronema omphalodes]
MAASWYFLVDRGTRIMEVNASELLTSPTHRTSSETEAGLESDGGTETGE